MQTFYLFIVPFVMHLENVRVKIKFVILRERDQINRLINNCIHLSPCDVLCGVIHLNIVYTVELSDILAAIIIVTKSAVNTYWHNARMLK